ncbi:hypothetical protein MKW92_031007 [Papaver armeniacum]|nr:hypothetical protein MKW92_031007 [Papaver armeniacum]
MLACFSKPSAGEILWNGHDIRKSGVFEQYKLQLNWLSLRDAVKEKFTVLDNSGKSKAALELMGLPALLLLPLVLHALSFASPSRPLSLSSCKEIDITHLTC